MKIVLKSVHIEKEFYNTYEILKINKEKGGDYSSSPFDTFKDIFLLSALFAVKNDVAPIELKKPYEAFKSQYFNDIKDVPLLYVIAFNKDKSRPELLVNDDYVIKAVEEYSNAGFPLLQESISGVSQNIKNLSKYIEEELSDFYESQKNQSSFNKESNNSSNEISSSPNN